MNLQVVDDSRAVRMQLEPKQERQKSRQTNRHLNEPTNGGTNAATKFPRMHKHGIGKWLPRRCCSSVQLDGWRGTG